MWPAVLWLIAGIALIAAEVLSGEFVLLMLGGGALAAAGASFLVPDSPVVGGVTLPSGEYTVQGLGNSGNAISIRKSDQTAKGLTLAIRCESGKTPEQSKLVFHRYGDRYFLAKIWMAGDNSGHEFPKSRREAEVAMDYPAQEVVLVASLR